MTVEILQKVDEKIDEKVRRIVSSLFEHISAQVSDMEMTKLAEIQREGSFTCPIIIKHDFDIKFGNVSEPIFDFDGYATDCEPVIEFFEMCDTPYKVMEYNESIEWETSMIWIQSVCEGLKKAGFTKMNIYLPDDSSDTIMIIVQA